MLFKVKATTAFMKGKLGGVKNEWRTRSNVQPRRCDEDDVRRDMKVGEPIVMVESTDGKDWRWVAKRNLIPLEN